MSKSKTPPKKGKAASTFLDPRIAGLEQHPAKSLIVDGKAMSKSSLVGKLVAIQRVIRRADDLDTQHTQAIRDRDAALTANAGLLQDLDPALRTLVGKDINALRKFGMSPPKARTALPAADRLIATQRMNDTRTALGTRGTQQRKGMLDQIQGKPQVQVVDPDAQSAAPAPSPAALPVSPAVRPAAPSAPAAANEVAPTAPNAAKSAG